MYPGQNEDKQKKKKIVKRPNRRLKDLPHSGVWYIKFTLIDMGFKLTAKIFYTNIGVIFFTYSLCAESVSMKNKIEKKYISKYCDWTTYRFLSIFFFSFSPFLSNVAIHYTYVAVWITWQILCQQEELSLLLS